MRDLVAISVALGAVATFACIMAVRDGGRLKQAEGRDPRALVALWIAIASYAGGFTLIRLAYVAHWDTLLFPFFVIQTLGGAATIVALAALVMRIQFGDLGTGMGIGFFLATAIFAVYEIFSGGLIGPTEGLWSVEFLPKSGVARGVVGAAYVAAPTAMAALVVAANRSGDPTGHESRLNWFAASMVLIFVPSAIKYVFLVPDVWNVALAVLVAGGAVLGWLSYHVDTNADSPAKVGHEA